MVTVASLPRIPSEVRTLIRQGEFRETTSGVAPGFAQANLAVLPKELAFEFLIFCQRNPKPCPILEVLEPGETEPRLIAPGADVRYDIPRYRVYRDGVLDLEVDDISGYWQDDLVAFLLGCSFSFEYAMVNAGIELRHMETRETVSMYISNIETSRSGLFSGPTVVSMRPIAREKVVKAVQVTSRYPSVHGAPVHIGDPKAIGIRDLSKPDFGDAVEIKEGEVPVFWACGVTPQAVAMKSRPSLMITHAPGYMFITDKRDEDYAVI